MTIHAVEISSDGQTEDIIYTCSRDCQDDVITQVTGLMPNEVAVPQAGSAESVVEGRKVKVTWGRVPGGAETDYDVHCGGCEDLLWHGMSNSV